MIEVTFLQEPFIVSSSSFFPPSKSYIISFELSSSYFSLYLYFFADKLISATAAITMTLLPQICSFKNSLDKVIPMKSLNFFLSTQTNFSHLERETFSSKQKKESLAWSLVVEVRGMI